jgi:ATP-dependent Clp protease ATP-binding subunit ClpC
LQRDVEDILAEKILFGELRPGQIVLVDVAPEGTVNEDGLAEYFTFTGTQKAASPDLELTEIAGGSSGLQDT